MKRDNRLSELSSTRREFLHGVGITFAIHFLITLIASRGRHFAWVVFLAISILAITATWQ